MGTACSGLCAAATTCDGAGNCGNPNDCAPVGGTCTFRAYEDMTSVGYWFCTDVRSQAMARNPYMQFRIKGARPDDEIAVEWLDNRGESNRAAARVPAPG